MLPWQRPRIDAHAASPDAETDLDLPRQRPLKFLLARNTV
jgi:hypothetical protein